MALRRQRLSFLSFYLSFHMTLLACIESMEGGDQRRINDNRARPQGGCRSGDTTAACGGKAEWYLRTASLDPSLAQMDFEVLTKFAHGL